MDASQVHSQPQLDDDADADVARGARAGRDRVNDAATPPVCPVCQGRDTAVVGPPLYREPTTVAGVAIDLSDLDLVWRRCAGCGYQFIHPGVPEDRLLACYARAATGHWGTANADYGVVRFYEQKKQVLERFAPGKRVLDFGCFDGGFLAYLGSAYEKFGIEPSADAARVAATRGVTILGATAAEAVATTETRGSPVAAQLDAVVSFDVFEHLNDPVATLRDLRKLLAPGGIMLIETGDSDTPVWRRLGTRYPYACYIEHVGLFNRRSIAEAARRAGMSLVHFENTEHHVIELGDRVRFRLYGLAYSLLRAADRLHLPLPSRRLREIARGPMPRVVARDHFLAVLKAD
jgi:SAM-dependent methyltransferase